MTINTFSKYLIEFIFSFCIWTLLPCYGHSINNQAQLMLDSYGNGQELSKSELKKYLKNHLVKKVLIGEIKNRQKPKIDYKIFKDKGLFLDPNNPKCFINFTVNGEICPVNCRYSKTCKNIRKHEISNDNIVRSWNAMNPTKKGFVDSKALYENNSSWKQRVDTTTEHHWRLMQKAIGKLHSGQKIRTLNLELEKKFSENKTAKNRYDRIKKFLKNKKSVKVEELTYYFFDEKLSLLDIDCNEMISPDEFFYNGSLLTSVDQVKLFLQYTNNGSMLALRDSKELYKNRLIFSDLNTYLIAELNNYRILNNNTIKTTSIIKHFKKLVKDESCTNKAKEKPRKKMFTYIPSKGILLGRHATTIEKGKTKVIGQHTMMRVIKSFTESGDKAEAAMLGIKRNYENNERNSVAEIALALRFESYGGNNKDYKQSFGLEIIRSGSGENETNSRQVLFENKFIFKHKPNGLLTYSALTITPIYHWNLRPHNKRLTGLIQWEPVIKLSDGISSGEWIEKGIMKYLFIPKVGYEQKPYGSKNYARYDIYAGAKLSNKLQLNYNLIQRIAVNAQNINHWCKKISIDWPLDQQKIYSIIGSYEDGEDLPNFQHEKKYNIGFGLKY